MRVIPDFGVRWLDGALEWNESNAKRGAQGMQERKTAPLDYSWKCVLNYLRGDEHPAWPGQRLPRGGRIWCDRGLKNGSVRYDAWLQLGSWTSSTLNIGRIGQFLHNRETEPAWKPKTPSSTQGEPTICRPRALPPVYLWVKDTRTGEENNMPDYVSDAPRPGLILTRRGGQIRVDATSDLTTHPDYAAEWGAVNRIDRGRVRFREVATIHHLPEALAAMLTDIFQLSDEGGGAKSA
jgi:hypothetical protein